MPGVPGRQGEKGEPMQLTEDEKQFFSGSPGPRYATTFSNLFKYIQPGSP
jgi:hypothetical protein